jgi:hypothetical protein
MRLALILYLDEPARLVRAARGHPGEHHYASALSDRSRVVTNSIFLS